MSKMNMVEAAQKAFETNRYAEKGTEVWFRPISARGLRYAYAWRRPGSAAGMNDVIRVPSASGGSGRTTSMPLFEQFFDEWEVVDPDLVFGGR